VRHKIDQLEVTQACTGCKLSDHFIRPNRRIIARISGENLGNDPELKSKIKRSHSRQEKENANPTANQYFLKQKRVDLDDQENGYDQV
jgi:hypothetical protein